MTDSTKKLGDVNGPLPTDEAQLDIALGTDDQRLIASKMGELQAWDAPANLINRFERKVVRARRFRFSTVLITGAAACLAIVAALYQPTERDTSGTANSGESLYDWHYEAVATSVLPGDGANLAGFSQVARGESQAQ